MNYPETLHKLYQINLYHKKKNGLNNCHRLDQLLNYPHHNFKSIHIAGTNGKGSVATMVANVLQFAGYKVGLFTSPHISCFRERIRVNGEKIPERDVETGLALLFKLIEAHDIPATFFELTTFLAFLYFSQQKVDFAIIEAGIGGKSDATNIIVPALSIITSISLDHSEILGNTLESIAEEKSGIIKPFIPIVVGPNVPLSIIENKARQCNSLFIKTDEKSSDFELENRSVAKAALDFLGQSTCISLEAILSGLKIKPPCRLETISQNPLIIFDAAHNPNGILNLFKALQVRFPGKKFNALFGFCKSKDVFACISIMKKYCNDFYPVASSNNRSMEIKKLVNELTKCGIDLSRVFKHASLHKSVEVAVSHAKEENHGLIVCGTFYIMDEVKRMLDFLHN